MVPRNINLVLDSYRDGKLEVRGVSGEMKVRSHNNSITLTNVSGSARVWSYNGNLKADFKAVAADGSLYLRTYNGHVDVSLPATLAGTVKFRSGTGQVLTDFSLDTRDDSVQVQSTAQGKVEITFDELVTGKINGGGLPISIETEKGNIRLRKRNALLDLDKMSESVQRLVPVEEDGDSVATVDEVEARRKTYENTKSFVEKDQMPEYLLHAAYAGVLEIERELAMKNVELDQVRKIEARLILVYEKAIRSYEAMMEDPGWRKRFPAMNLDDTRPYRRRRAFLQKELERRQDDGQQHDKD